MNFWSHKPIAAHQAAETFFQAARQLVDSIQQSAVPAGDEELDKFRADLQALAKRLALENPAESFEAAGAVSRTLEEYNLRVARGLRQHQSELRSIVSMLTETVSRCSTASGTSIHKLRDIEQRLERARVLDDIRTLKLQMGECLHSLKEESERQLKMWAEQIQELTHGLESAKRTVDDSGPAQTPSAPDADPLTGLPGRRSAQEALTQACDDPANRYAVLFVVDKVHAVNVRLGYGAGDQMLLVWHQLLNNWFPGEKKLHRWSGPAFFMLLHREDPPSRVRAEISGATSVRHEQLFKVGNRSVLMLVTAAHVVIPLAETTNPATLLKRLDDFVKARVEA